ncbi:MAG: hypothetical protein Q4G36_02665 [Paracoccus sp. (in: a-proteobacteria)]|nr:hypothetical protein [Paracoccus sp. (in: a-proteobacteria)]
MRFGLITIVVIVLIVVLASCGVDGPPVRPETGFTGSFQIGTGRGL